MHAQPRSRGRTSRSTWKEALHLSRTRQFPLEEESHEAAAPCGSTACWQRPLRPEDSGARPCQHSSIGTCHFDGPCQLPGRGTGSSPLRGLSEGRRWVFVGALQGPRTGLEGCLVCSLSPRDRGREHAGLQAWFGSCPLFSLAGCNRDHFGPGFERAWCGPAAEGGCGQL